MGIEDREYFRNSSRYSDYGSWELPKVCKFLLIANIVVFLLQIFFVRNPTPEDLRHMFGQDTEFADEVYDHWTESFAEDGSLAHLGFPKISIVQQWLELDTKKVIYQGQVWRLLTCAFCHDRLSIWHIVFNMLLLFWFGKMLELMYGSREFLLFYLAAALVASLTYIGLELITDRYAPAIGASGAVMAVVMLYAIHFPRHTILLFMVIPIEIRWLVVFYVIYDVHPVLLALAGDHMYTGVGHAAHLGGLAFGYVYWRYGIRLSALIDRLPQPTQNHRVGEGQSILQFPNARPSFDERVDSILRKVAKEGEDSLTDRERQLLNEASDRYRQ